MIIQLFRLSNVIYDTSNKITGVINQVFKPSQVQRHTRLKIYKTLARPILTYGSEGWIFQKTNEKRLTAAEMRLMRTTGCLLLEHCQIAEILEELKIDPITEYIQHHRRNWKFHVQMMSPQTNSNIHPMRSRNL